jgi:hypothetical protein
MKSSAHDERAFRQIPFDSDRPEVGNDRYARSLRERLQQGEVPGSLMKKSNDV